MHDMDENLFEVKVNEILEKAKTLMKKKLNNEVKKQTENERQE